MYFVYMSVKLFWGNSFGHSETSPQVSPGTVKQGTTVPPQESPGAAARVAGSRRKSRREPSNKGPRSRRKSRREPPKGRHAVVRQVVTASPGPCRRGRAAGRARFLRRATPGGCFFSVFFSKKGAFFLEKMEKNGILFQFGFLKQASTQTTEISLWRSGKTSRKS